MTLHVTDTRVADADRLLTHFERQGAPTDAVVPLLPALVSDDMATRDDAEAWINENALTGIGDLSTESQSERAPLASAARNHAMSLGASSTSIPGFIERFGADDQALNRVMDERMPQSAYPGARHNALTIAKAEAEQSLKPGESITDDGSVIGRDGRPTGQRVHLGVGGRLSGPAPLAQRTSEFSKRARQGRQTLDFSTKADDTDTDASAYGTGVNRPFFMEV